MSTRSNIKIEDEYGRVFFIDRSHDGFPENILPDIEAVVKRCEGRWSGAELGQFVSYFLGMHFNPRARIQHYEISWGPAGDESYTYWVKWDVDTRKYLYGVNE